VVARGLQKILHQSSDYEDLVQISFELIVRTLQKSRDEPIENLAAWSSAIAARVAIDAIRARVRERQFLEGEAGEAFENMRGAPLDRELDARSELAWLQGTLSSMKREQAEAVLLHDVLGHDLREIAVLTGSTTMAAQKRLSRGHLELKRRAAKRETANGR
jgi:RNA polymerase sigma factor (sigma-70 family)